MILLLLSSRIPKMLFLQITLMIEVRSLVLLLEHTRSDMAGELSYAPQKAWFSDRLARFIPIASVAFPPTALSLSHRSNGLDALDSLPVVSANQRVGILRDSSGC